MTPLRRWALVVTLLATAVLQANGAAARPKGEEGDQAEALFSLGRSLLEEGRLAEACVAFERSDELAPGAGTKFNLADCWERRGRLASAAQLFRRVAEQMAAAGQARLVALARSRAAEIEPRLTRLRLVPSNPSPHLRVQHNGTEVPRSEWGADLPVDPGLQQIVASAPGYESWTQEVTAQGEGVVVVVLVPPLQRSVDDTPPVPPPGQAMRAEESQTSTTTALFATGIAVGAAGLATLGVSLGLTLHAAALDHQADDHCGERYCDATGFELNESALSFARAATATMVVGGILTAAGLTLVLTAPVAAPQEGGEATLSLSPAGGSLRYVW